MGKSKKENNDEKNCDSKNIKKNSKKIKKESENIKKDNKNAKKGNVAKKNGPLKIVGFIILLIAIFLGVMYGTVKLLQKHNQNSMASNCSYVAKIDEENYYIAGAPQDIKFKVSSDDLSSYKLTDSNNNDIEFKIKKDKNGYFLVGKNKYKMGETYDLSIISDESKFEDENLSEAKSIKFKIKKSDVQEYKFNDAVKVVNKLDGITEDGDTKTLAIGSNNTYSEGDIIVLEENNNYTQAYKINTIENGVATLTDPTLTDIYKDLEYYQEINVNFENIKLNDDIKNQIEIAYEKTEWYQYLINECHAAVEPNISAKINGDKITLEVNITVKKDGDKTVGIAALKEHDIILSFKTELSCKVLADVDIKSHIDFAFNVSENFDCTIGLVNDSAIVKGVDEIEDEDYEKSLDTLFDLLEGNQDSAASKQEIYGVELPTSLYGMNIFVDFYVQTSFTVKVNATLEEKNSYSEVIGIYATSDGITPYSSCSCSNSELAVDVSGKGEERIGVGLDVGASIISKKIAYLEIGAETGIYATELAIGEVKYNSTESSGGITALGKIEAGFYANAKIKAHVNLIFRNLDYEDTVYDCKNVLFSYGNMNTMVGIVPEKSEITITSGNFTLPNIYKKMKNFETGSCDTSELINQSQLTITDVNGNEISGSMNLDSNNQATLIVAYKDSTHVFKTKIKVTVNDGSNKGVTVNRNNNYNSNSASSSTSESSSNSTITSITNGTYYRSKGTIVESKLTITNVTEGSFDFSLYAIYMPTAGSPNIGNLDGTATSIGNGKYKYTVDDYGIRYNLYFEVKNGNIVLNDECYYIETNKSTQNPYCGYNVTFDGAYSK